MIAAFVGASPDERSTCLRLKMPPQEGGRLLNGIVDRRLLGAGQAMLRPVDAEQPMFDVLLAKLRRHQVWGFEA